MILDSSEVLDHLLLPSNLLGVLGLLSLLVWAVGFRRLGAIGAIAALVLILICGCSPFGPAALLILENRFPEPVIKGDVTGIVMLGGAVDIHLSVARGQVALRDSAERVTAVGDLARRYPEARIILSGGWGRPERPTESSLARDLLVSLGIPSTRIELEEQSQNTCQSAVESKLVARPASSDQWLLVTSASHMPRAVACFRAAGFPITPFPVDYRTRGSANLRGVVPSVAIGLAATD